MTANTQHRRLAPVVLAAVLLPVTMPIASASFTQQLGVAAGVAVAPAEKEAPRPPATQAVGDLPTGSPEGPMEPVIEPQPAGPTGTAPADGPPSSAPEKAPGSGDQGDHTDHGNHAGQGKDPHEPCPATGCAPGGEAPPPAGDTPGTGAPDTGAAVAPPLSAIDHTSTPRQPPAGSRVARPPRRPRTLAPSRSIPQRHRREAPDKPGVGGGATGTDTGETAGTNGGTAPPSRGLAARALGTGR